jgi:hypothetical protein
MPRYNPKGLTRYYFTASLASPGSPSAAAVVAGTALHVVLKTLTGFTSEVEDLDNSDASSTWNKTLPGGETPAASSMTLYAGTASGDPERTVRTALAEGLNGFIVVSDTGAPEATTGRGDVFPVRIKANNMDRMVENAVQTYTVGFALYDPPFKQVTFAA